MSPSPPSSVYEIWRYMNGTSIGPEYFPGTANVKTDAEVLQYIRLALIEIWHAAAACKMGMQWPS